MLREILSDPTRVANDRPAQQHPPGTLPHIGRVAASLV
jgi:hypothetical protein